MWKKKQNLYNVCYIKLIAICFIKCTSQNILFYYILKVKFQRKIQKKWWNNNVINRLLLLRRKNIRCKYEKKSINTLFFFLLCLYKREKSYSKQDVHNATLMKMYVDHLIKHYNAWKKNILILFFREEHTNKDQTYTVFLVVLQVLFQILHTLLQTKNQVYIF